MNPSSLHSPVSQPGSSVLDVSTVSKRERVAPTTGLCLPLLAALAVRLLKHGAGRRIRAVATMLVVLPSCSLSTTGTPIDVYDAPQSVLLLLDLQRDFLEVEGRLPVAPGQVDPLITAVRHLAESAEARGIAAVQVLNEFDPDDSVANWFRNGAALRGQPGADIDPRIPRADAPTFSKSASDAFSNEAFDLHLRAQKVNHIIVAGVFADACVKHTVRGALNRGYRVTVVTDGVAATSDEDVLDSIEVLVSEGAEAMSSHEFIAQH